MCSRSLLLIALALATTTGCSLIVDPTIRQSFGEECRTDGQCTDGVCREGHCTAACDADSPCPGGATCGAAGFCAVGGDVTSPTDVAGDAAGEPSTLTVGFLYVGPVGDHGWTLTHDVGRRYAEEKLPYLESHYAASVAPSAAPETIEEMIADGDRVIVGTSHDFIQAVQNAALNHPEVRFLICSGFLSAPNMGSYFGRMYQAKYLAGYVAGKTTKTHKIGFIGAVRIAETVRHLNAFTRGVREADPEAVVYVRWIDAWFDPAKEAQYTKDLVADEVDVIAGGTDTSVPIETVEHGGEEGAALKTPSGKDVAGIGYDNPDACTKAPTTCIASPFWNWGPMYTRLFREMHEGTWDPREVIWEQIQLDSSKTVVDIALDEDLSTTLKVMVESTMKAQLATDDPDERQRPFVGPLARQDGTLVLNPGERLTDTQLLNMCWYVEGVMDLDAGGTPQERASGCQGDDPPGP